MSLTGGSSLVGIKQSKVTMSESSGTIIFPVAVKPYGLLIACDNDDRVPNTVAAKRVSAIWSDYGGGGYYGGRIAVNRNGTPDHSTLTASVFVYDQNAGIFTVNQTIGTFVAGETYYLWYFTIPF